MNILCPHCETRVNADSNGSCPICRRRLDLSATPEDRDDFFKPAEEVRQLAASEELMSCPMCGASTSSTATICQNCGEVFLHGSQGFASGGLWRLGDNLLVMHKDAEFPDRCIKTNQPANGLRLKRNLSWHSPWLYFTIILCGLIPYVIIALIVRKTATIYIGLSQESFDQRKKSILIAWLISLLGIALMVGGISIVDQNDAGGILMLLGIVLIIAGLIYGSVTGRMVAVKKIKDDHIWLKGCHKDFLAHLPNWNGEA